MKSSSLPAVAWFVRGQTSNVWLNEISQWHVPLDRLECRVIPRSIDDNTPIGALFTGPFNSASGPADSPGTSSNAGPSRSRYAQPYACRADRLYLPIDACVVPDVTDAELSDLMPSDCEFVWHPSAGLIRFEPSDNLRVADLLQVLPERSGIWDRAVAGTSFRSRLISVEAEVPMTADSILNQAADDIGSSGDDLDRLPATPDEPFGGKLNQLMKSVRSVWRGMPGQPNPSEKNDPRNSDQENRRGSPGGKTLPGLMGGLASGVGILAAVVGRGIGLILLPLAGAGAAAGKMLERLPKFPLIDQLARNQEINRLLHLLKNDPDVGLRFALPIRSEDRSRGLASPSNQLPTRDITFSLNRLQGTGPADHWNISADQRFQLLQQYRDLASREMRLGRHRRAAYIFAELLNDLVLAAGALENGHHYHEAAILYRDRLKRPPDAARCFERAGLLEQAAEIFASIGLFERAAGLYVRLERHDKAQELFRTCVQRSIAQGDFRAAARVLNEKLHDLDGALELLKRGWLSSASAEGCVEDSFVLMSVHGRHLAAAHRIAELRETPIEHHRVTMLARVLAKVHTDYPEQSVGSAAFDATQVVVSRAIRSATPLDAAEMLGSIRRLAAEDRLLSRDCDRFLEQRKAAVSAPKKRAAPSPAIEVIDTFDLHEADLELSWLMATSNGSTAYALARRERTLFLSHFQWNDPTTTRASRSWSDVPLVRSLIFELHPDNNADVIVHAIGAEPIARKPLQRAFQQAGTAGSPKWATRSTVALTIAEGGFAWRIFEEDGLLVIDCLSPSGEPLISKNLMIPFDLAQIEGNRVTIYAGLRIVRIGIGPHLFRLRLNSKSDDLPVIPYKLDSDIRGLMGARIEGTTWLCVLFETGGHLINDDDPDECFPVGEGVDFPCGAFLNDNRLVIAGIGSAIVYELVDSRLRTIGQHALDFVPVSVTRTNKIGTFAVFGENGTVKIVSYSAGSL